MHGNRNLKPCFSSRQFGLGDLCCTSHFPINFLESQGIAPCLLCTKYCTPITYYASYVARYIPEGTLFALIQLWKIQNVVASRPYNLTAHLKPKALRVSLMRLSRSPNYFLGCSHWRTYSEPMRSIPPRAVAKPQDCAVSRTWLCCAAPDSQVLNHGL